MDSETLFAHVATRKQLAKLRLDTDAVIRAIDEQLEQMQLKHEREVAQLSATTMQLLETQTTVALLCEALDQYEEFAELVKRALFARDESGVLLEHVRRFTLPTVDRTGIDAPYNAKKGGADV